MFPGQGHILKILNSTTLSIIISFNHKIFHIKPNLISIEIHVNISRFRKHGINKIVLFFISSSSFL